MRITASVPSALALLAVALGGCCCRPCGPPCDRSPRGIVQPAPAPFQDAGLVSVASPNAEAASADGKYRLRLQNVVRTTERDAAGVERIFASFDTSINGLAGDDVVEVDQPLTSAISGDGLERAFPNLPHEVHQSLRVQGRGTTSVSTSRIPIAASVDRFQQLQFALRIARVSEWKTCEFTVGGPGRTKPWICGPFELVATTEGDMISIGITTLPLERRAESDAFRKRVPLRRLDPSWALEEPVLRDASAVTLWSPGMSVMRSGGARTFVEPEAWLRPPSDIAYPVTVYLRLPEKFVLETQTFRFSDVAVPPPLR